MKWIVAIVLTLAAVLGAALAAALFLLPARMEVTRAMEIARPRALLYPLLADLRTFNEFSPWFDQDPKAEYTFSGPARGVGQRMAWDSTVKSVGQGAQTIVRLEPDALVETELDLGVRGKALGRWTLTPSPQGARVAWTLVSECGEGIASAVCRYKNLLQQPAAAKELDSGLAKLKAVGERMPNVDIAGLKLDLVSAPAQDWAFVEGETAQTAEAFAAALRQSLAYVEVFFSQNGLIGAGPPTVVITKWADGKFGFRAGMAFSGPMPTAVFGVKAGKTPAGRALRAVHVGTFESRRALDPRIEAYVLAHRFKRAGDTFEVFPKPDPAAVPVPAAAPAEGVAAEGVAAATTTDPAAPALQHAEIYVPVL